MDCSFQPARAGSSRATSWPSAQRARALRVLAGDDRQRRGQRGRHAGLGAGQAVEQVGHRGAVGQVEAEHGCLSEPGQPGSESDAYLHCCARAYAAGRRHVEDDLDVVAHLQRAHAARGRA